MTTTNQPTSHEAQPRRERGLLMRLVDDIFLEVRFRPFAGRIRGCPWDPWDPWDWYISIFIYMYLHGMVDVRGKYKSRKTNKLLYPMACLSVLSCEFPRA